MDGSKHKVVPSSFIGFLVKNILWQFSSDLKFELLVHEKLFLPAFRAFLGNQKLRWCCSKQGTYFHLLSLAKRGSTLPFPLRIRRS